MKSAQEEGWVRELRVPTQFVSFPFFVSRLLIVCFLASMFLLISCSAHGVFLPSRMCCPCLEPLVEKLHVRFNHAHAKLPRGRSIFVPGVLTLKTDSCEKNPSQRSSCIFCSFHATIHSSTPTQRYAISTSTPKHPIAVETPFPPHQMTTATQDTHNQPRTTHTTTTAIISTTTRAQLQGTIRACRDVCRIENQVFHARLEIRAGHPSLGGHGESGVLHRGRSHPGSRHAAGRNGLQTLSSPWRGRRLRG